jgi:cytochrome c biogenesis protein CcmG/thiol:disulfide interchange protein DsbE
MRSLARGIAAHKLLIAIAAGGAAAIIGVSAAAGLGTGAGGPGTGGQGTGGPGTGGQGTGGPGTGGPGTGAGSSRVDGRVAPDFTVAALGTPDGQISLSRQYRDKPVIVNFWASWCGPCQQETPLLARWYKQQHGAVSLLGLDENDNSGKALAFAASKGVTYRLGFDPRTQVAAAYNVSGIPQTLFLDASHRVVLHLYGAVTEADLARGLKLLKT